MTVSLVHPNRPPRNQPGTAISPVPANGFCGNPAQFAAFDREFQAALQLSQLPPMPPWAELTAAGYQIRLASWDHINPDNTPWITLYCMPLSQPLLCLQLIARDTAQLQYMRFLTHARNAENALIQECVRCGFVYSERGITAKLDLNTPRQAIPADTLGALIQRWEALAELAREVQLGVLRVNAVILDFDRMSVARENNTPFQSQVGAILTMGIDRLREFVNVTERWGNGLRSSGKWNVFVLPSVAKKGRITQNPLPDGMLADLQRRMSGPTTLITEGLRLLQQRGVPANDIYPQIAKRLRETTPRNWYDNADWGDHGELDIPLLLKKWEQGFGERAIRATRNRVAQARQQQQAAADTAALANTAASVATIGLLGWLWWNSGNNNR